ncbi:hypothetical protein LZ30DRAFT_607202 [Colletotrichum cereale]|nr:hypothetical protein LZ30DRAFT_607202 [Colletotrichum cereale]
MGWPSIGGFDAATKQETEDADGNVVQLHETVRVLLHGHQDPMERLESTLPQDYLNRQRDVPEHQR